MAPDTSGADSICALSSASGASGLAVVRVSGPQAIRIVSSFCPGAGLEQVPNFHAVPVLFELPGVGRVHCEVYVFRAPTSYTTEDVAEIHLPGSMLLVEKLLLALSAEGARPAGPGEFTRRAYLGGRIDLAQAEAVGAIISARSTAELAAAGRTLTGSLSEKVAGAAAQLKNLLAVVEASIDFADQDIQLVSAREISSRIRAVSELLQAAVQVGPEPRRDMLKVLICGTANVGKSSLFNRLLASERTLVSPSPGTTRDVVSAVLRLGSVDILLLDSAGRVVPHSPQHQIEELSSRALDKSLADADVVLFVTEAYRQPTESELEFLDQIECRKLLVANKCDLETRGLKRDGQASSLKPHACSCLTGEGVENLRETLERLILGEVERHPDALALSVRQRDALSHASSSLQRAREAAGEELIAEDLREALSCLGEITGETLAEEILNQIFDQFCIGK